MEGRAVRRAVFAFLLPWMCGALAAAEPAQVPWRADMPTALAEATPERPVLAFFTDEG